MRKHIPISNESAPLHCRPNTATQVEDERGDTRMPDRPKDAQAHEWLRSDSRTADKRARKKQVIYQQHEAEAVNLLDDIIASGNEVSKPHALFRKGEIMEKRKAYADAEQLFLQIVDQYPGSYMADAALMHAAMLEQNELKDKESAKQHYEQLIDDYPTSIYTAQAKKNYRKL